MSGPWGVEPSSLSPLLSLPLCNALPCGRLIAPANICEPCCTPLSPTFARPLGRSCGRFCYDCIMKWSEQENRCPFCKQRFASVGRKRLRCSEDSGGGGVAGTSEDCCGGGGGGGGMKRLRGEVLETHRLEDRQQVCVCVCVCV